MNAFAFVYRPPVGRPRVVGRSRLNHRATCLVGKQEAGLQVASEREMHTREKLARNHRWSRSILAVAACAGLFGAGAPAPAPQPGPGLAGSAGARDNSPTARH